MKNRNWDFALDGVYFFGENPSKKPGPEDQALVVPRGDLLCWKFIELLKSQISNRKKMNVEHRTLNIEHRMWMSLRSIFSIKLEHRRCTLIRRWKFDVRCWTFVFKSGFGHLSRVIRPRAHGRGASRSNDWILAFVIYPSTRLRVVSLSNHL